MITPSIRNRIMIFYRGWDYYKPLGKELLLWCIAYCKKHGYYIANPRGYNNWLLCPTCELEELYKINEDSKKFKGRML